MLNIVNSLDGRHRNIETFALQDLVAKLLLFDCEDGDVEAFFRDIQATIEGNPEDSNETEGSQEGCPEVFLKSSLHHELLSSMKRDTAKVSNKWNHLSKSTNPAKTMTFPHKAFLFRMIETLVEFKISDAIPLK